MKNRAYKDLSFEERLGLLVARKMASRQDRKLRTLLAKARFRYQGAIVEDINFTAKKGITKDEGGGKGKKASWCHLVPCWFSMYSLLKYPLSPVQS